MMTVLLENMHARTDEAKVKLRHLNQFWSPEKIDLARDHVLGAISKRRHGFPDEWDRLSAMEPEEWQSWLRGIAENSN